MLNQRRQHHPAHHIPHFARPLVAAAERGEDITPYSLAIARGFGFDGFLYAANTTLLPADQIRPFVYSTWPSHVFQAYDDRRYFLVDPRVHDALQSVMPVLWDQTTYRGQSEQGDAFLDWLERYGICSGVTCPLRDMRGRLGALFLSCSVRTLDAGRRAMLERNLPEIMMFGLCFHELFVNGDLDPRAGPPCEDLSAREIECLRLARAGKTGGTIAAELGISLRTVQTHFDKLRRKLGAANRQDAIARGLQMGII